MFLEDRWDEKLPIMIIPFFASTLVLTRTEGISISNQEQRKKPPRCEERLPHHLPKFLVSVSTCILCDQ